MSEDLVHSILKTFKSRFPQNPILIQSPGRINLIGEHTDYNGGFVFPATIDKYIVVALAKSDKPFSSIYAVDIDETMELHLDRITKKEKGSWQNYVAGVVYGILKKTGNLGNFNMVFGGNIPIGAGLSSSAALENGIAFGLNRLFDLGLDLNEIMHISIEAEHQFAGVECGVMDQFSNLHGKENQAILLDCADMSYSYFPLQTGDYSLLLINTNVKHRLTDSPYNRRKQSCHTGFEIIKDRFPRVPSLSRATLRQLDEVKDKMSPEVYKRCRYVIEENQRVLKAKETLEHQDPDELGRLLFASHKGLSELYEVSCEELDFLVDLAKKEPGVAGSRMMGGGFGGCTINLVKKDALNPFIAKVKKRYQDRFGITPDFYPVKITGGIKTLEA